MFFKFKYYLILFLISCKSIPSNFEKISTNNSDFLDLLQLSSMSCWQKVEPWDFHALLNNTIIPLNIDAVWKNSYRDFYADFLLPFDIPIATLEYENKNTVIKTLDLSMEDKQNIEFFFNSVGAEKLRWLLCAMHISITEKASVYINKKNMLFHKYFYETKANFPAGNVIFKNIFYLVKNNDAKKLFKIQSTLHAGLFDKQIAFLEWSGYLNKNLIIPTNFTISTNKKKFVLVINSFN